MIIKVTGSAFKIKSEDLKGFWFLEALSLQDGAPTMSRWANQITARDILSGTNLKLHLELMER